MLAFFCWNLCPQVAEEQKAIFLQKEGQRNLYFGCLTETLKRPTDPRLPSNENIVLLVDDWKHLILKGTEVVAVVGDSPFSKSLVKNLVGRYLTSVLRVIGDNQKTFLCRRSEDPDAFINQFVRDGLEFRIVMGPPGNFC